MNSILPTKDVKAVILAAGLGTRLRELVVEKPKCMVHVNGRPIIGWQLAALVEAGVTDISVVTGYHAAALRKYVSANFPGLTVNYIHSDEYANTNNMYSLWLSRHHVGNSSLIFMNADVAFDPAVVTRLLDSGHSAIAVDEGSFNEESMKVIRQPGSEFICGISKQYTRDEALGCSIDVYFLQPPDAQMLYAQCDAIIVGEQQLKQWSEVALHRLLSAGAIRMKAVNVSGLDWFEIDNARDLAIAENMFSASALRRDMPKLWFVDLDGTLYLGARMVEGAPDFVRTVREGGSRVVFLSNNSSKSHAEYVRRLSALGIEAAEADVLLSTDALAAYLNANGVHRAFILGTKSMKEVLARYGITHADHDIEAVLLGYHTELTYTELASAALFLQVPSIRYYATHPDRVCPTEKGLIPDAGAIAELLYVTTGRRPEGVFGKPDAQFIQPTLSRWAIEPRDAVVVGDRAYTDMALARSVGARFVGVLSGECNRRDFEGEHDILIVTSVGHLLNEWRRGTPA